jgi:nucleoside-diphosphate-sugar epimerase
VKSLSGKSILLTGATGFIGAHLANRLRQLPDIHLVLLTRQPLSSVARETIVRSSLDQLTRSTWAEHRIDKIDVIFHLGAFTPKRGSEANAIEAIYRDNLIGTRTLLESLPNPPERIVFSSTLDVYAPPTKGQVLTEESRLEPVGLYGASKLFCEQLVKIHALQQGCGYAILRYGHIYGPGEAAYAKLIPQTIKTLLNHESPTLYGDGSALRDFMFVADAVEATIRAALSPHMHLEPINIVSGDSRPIRFYVELLAEILKTQKDIQYLREKPNGTSLRFSNLRLREMLGDWETVDMRDGLSQEIESYRNTVGQQ